MKKYYFYLVFLLLLVFAQGNAVVLFEITNENGDPVFVVDDGGITIINYEAQTKGKALGDTLMTISSRSIKAFVNNNGKGLSRSFSVTTSTTGKGEEVDVLEITSETATMREGVQGDEYTHFGPENIFLGLLSGSSIGTGVGNTFVGNYAGTKNTDGDFNVYMGNNAGANNTTGNSNVFIGDAAGYTYSGSFGNVFIGQDAAKNLTSGQRSVMVGYSSGSDIDSLVYGNVYIGGVAGKRMNGWYNVVIGEAAGENYSLGSDGWRNVFVGNSAGRFSNGSENIYIGYGTGEGTFDDPHTGSRNIYLGTQTGWAKRTESDILRIGSLIWGNLDLPRMLVVDGDNTDNAMGRKFFVNGSAGGTSAWNNDSDGRLKKEIRKIDGALEKVSKLRGVTYEWKNTEKHESGRRMGFIAQETDDIIPEVVDYSKENDHYSMQYAPITALLVEAVKELKKEFSKKFSSIAVTSEERINEQDRKIDALIKENEKLKRKVSELEELRAEIEDIKTKLTGYASK